MRVPSPQISVGSKLFWSRIYSFIHLCFRILCDHFSKASINLIRNVFGRYRFDFIENLIPLWGCLLVYSTSMFACLSGYIWYMYLRSTQTDMIHAFMVPNSWVSEQNSYFAKERKQLWIEFHIKKQSSI